MKKLATQITGLALGMSALGIAHAADGTVNFTGEILEEACVVEPGSQNLAVNLGKISKKAFTAPGSVAGSKPFSVIVGGCPETVSSASVVFDGTTDATNTSLLAINGSGGTEATGVGVALYEADGTTQIPVHQPSKPVVLDSTVGASNTLNFIAKYMSTNADVTGGAANATATFTLTYQ
ncbi:fimbrial protein [Pseudomonas knackmussii]|uniref:fimbrial protein n=1 Tax=Pseudomonas knackmussii TaxID=65741 RepID=UPI003BC7F971